MNTKPCDYTCEKCGSGDVLLKFYTKGDSIHEGLNQNKEDGNFIIRAYCRKEAKRDHIEYHCRTCQYEWRTLPLDEICSYK